jgi:hypothetical protein
MVISIEDMELEHNDFAPALQEIADRITTHSSKDSDILKGMLSIFLSLASHYLLVDI